jgi:hypothetical protein
MKTEETQSSEEFFARAIRGNIQKLPLSVVWSHACALAEEKGIPLVTYKRMLKIAKFQAPRP